MHSKASALTDGIPGTRVLWGDSSSNSAIAALAGSLNVKWQGDQLVIGDRSFPAATHVPAFIQRLPDGSTVVLNSGLTFREAHDKTNSLQNPKLPDWAILDISRGANTESAGNVVAADFFVAEWRVGRTGKSPQDR